MRKCKGIISMLLTAALLGALLTATAATAPNDLSETGEMQRALQLHLMNYREQKGGDYTITTDMIYPLCRVSPGKVTDDMSVHASADISAWIATTETSDGDNPQVVVRYDSASKKYTVEEPVHDYDELAATAKKITAQGDILGTGHTTRSERFDNRQGYLMFGDVCGFVLAETGDGQPVAYAVGNTAKAFAGGKDVVSLDTLRYIAQLEYAYAVKNSSNFSIYYFGLNNLPGGYSIPASIAKPREINTGTNSNSGSSAISSAVLSSLSQASASGPAADASPRAEAWMWLSILFIVIALGEGVWIIWRPKPKGGQAGGAPLDDIAAHPPISPTGTEGDA